jgi:GTPase involved in cell partitioning and DNA repair
MRFVDECKVKVVAGDGGNGVGRVSPREVHPLRRPLGRRRRQGGDVVFEGDEGLSTLLDFTHARTCSRAERGEHGSRAATATAAAARTGSSASPSARRSATPRQASCSST